MSGLIRRLSGASKPAAGGAPADNTITGSGNPKPKLVDISVMRDQTMKDLGAESWFHDNLTIWVYGASGDLAKKKTYPSMFALYEGGLLPPSAKVQIVGYARSPSTDAEFRAKIMPFLTGKTPTDQKKHNAEEFLKLCTYHAGQYDSGDDAKRVSAAATALHKIGPEVKENRLFYLALPPTQFVNATSSVKAGGLTTSGGFNRVVVEKPFGRDTETAKKLGQDMANIFTEDFLYRIDHYLGKEMVQNMVTMRFANAWLEPTWNRNYISAVQISFKEDIGTMGRGGYFDNFGIIRDVIQNHLMQVFAIATMEAPVRVAGEGDFANYIRDEKVKVLKCVRPVALDDVVTGQYVTNGKEPGYLEDTTVPPGSNCPTFATVVIYIDNARWQGVPFIIKAGKALDDRRSEVRIQFKQPPSANCMFGIEAELPKNELVFRVQPKEAVYMKTLVKQPGLKTAPVLSELDLSYDKRYPMVQLEDAYTKLLLDVLRGKQGQFVRNDELMASWEIFTPILHAIDAGAKKPEPYVFGGRGPKGSDELIKRVGWQYNADYALQYLTAKSSKQ